MRYAEMSEFNRLVIGERDVPQVMTGEALIRTRHVGVCGSDLHIFEGKHPTARPPLVLGHEFYGELVEIDAKTELGLRAGDLVSAHPLTSCGVCVHCLGGHQNRCERVAIFGVHRDGCYAEYMKVAADRLVRLDSDVDPEVAALIEPLAVGLHDLRRSRLKVGESVLIIGAGPIGTILAILSRHAGAGEVLVCDVDPQRIEFARSLGLDAQDPRSDEFQAQTSNPRFERVFEVSGTQPGCDTAIRATRAGGAVVLVGIPSGPYSISAASSILRELEILGVRIHSFANFRDAAMLINHGHINSQLKKLVTTVYTLDEIPSRMSRIGRDKSIVKALIRFS